MGLLDAFCHTLTTPGYYCAVGFAAITIIKAIQICTYALNASFIEVYPPVYYKDMMQALVTMGVIWRFCYLVALPSVVEGALALIQVAFCTVLLYLPADPVVRYITIAQILCPVLLLLTTVRRLRFDYAYTVGFNDSVLPILLSHSMFFLNYSFDGYAVVHPFLRRLPLVYFLLVVIVKLLYLSDYLAVELANGRREMAEMAVGRNKRWVWDRHTPALAFFGYVMAADVVMLVLRAIYA